jgi:hypothetical protein
MHNPRTKAVNALLDALAQLSRQGNPFGRLGLHNVDHAVALSDACIAGNDRAEIYACVRFARRYGHLPEGCYLDGYFFDSFCDQDGLDEAMVAELRRNAWAFRDKVTAVTVAVANCAA